jgi:site-specific DNA-methyltransferase (adenine-specific)
MTRRMPAPRNRTMTLTGTERRHYAAQLLRVDAPVEKETILDQTIGQDLTSAVHHLPSGFVDLLFLDPPYNMKKTFKGSSFAQRPVEQYAAWMDAWLSTLVRCLKPNASVYICGDWRSSTAIELVARKYFIIRNRITWEREKGRGAKANWKNASEDIWYCTMSSEYTFNLDAVKLKRKVIAPYTHRNGEPKDWQKTDEGSFRITHPSNMWTDLTVPFWSMTENTEHPTQKPEKLLAKIVLASSNEGDVVMDPFLGSGTTSVVAKKLGRRYVGIEVDETYACLAQKRLEQASGDATIQGIHGGMFYERNSTSKDDEKNTRPRGRKVQSAEIKDRKRSAGISEE